MAREVMEALKEQMKPAEVRNTRDDKQRPRDRQTELPTCYRCGQVGHV